MNDRIDGYTLAELDEFFSPVFAAAREDIDSMPYAHADAMDSAISAYVPVTPSGGAGCPIVLLAGTIAFLTLLVAVSQLVMAVTS